MSTEPFIPEVAPDTLRDFTSMPDHLLQDYIHTFTAQANAAYMEHIRLWEVVGKLIERDIVNGASALEIAQAVALLQAGQAKCYDLYLLRGSSLTRREEEHGVM